MATAANAHTPGPWAIRAAHADIGLPEDNMLGAVAYIVGADRVEVAKIIVRPVAEFNANTRLIAAAPALLEALEGMLAIAEAWEAVDGRKNIQLEHSDAVNAARAAHAKATGQAVFK